MEGYACVAKATQYESSKEMKLPSPQTSLGKAIERAIFVAVIAGIGAYLKDPSVTGGGVMYFGIKTIYDLLNSNVKNI